MSIENDAKLEKINRVDFSDKTDQNGSDGHFRGLVDYTRLVEARNEIYHKYCIIQEIIQLLDDLDRKDVLDEIVKQGILTKQQIKKYLEEDIYI